MKQKTFKYTLLNRLFVFQMLTVLVVLTAVYIAMYQQKQSATLLAIARVKQSITPVLSERQDEWRIWHQLGLQEALHRDLAIIHSHYPEIHIEIVSPELLPKILQPYHMILPSPDNATAGFYVLATIHREKLLVHKGFSSMLFMSLISFGVLFGFVIFYSNYYFRRKIYRPLIQLNESFKSKQAGADFNIDHIKATEEIKDFVESTKEIINREKEAQWLLAMGKICFQVAHDIRSPLSSMQVALEYFGDLKMDNSMFSKHVNLLQLSSKRLTTIADDLLKKHKQEKVDNVMQHFSLHQILDELIGEYQSQERYKTVKFTKEYLAQSVELNGNQNQLQRAFGNIVKNAIEAMNRHGTLTIGTKQKDKTVVVIFQDTGSGMTEEKLNKVLQGGFSEGKEVGYGIGTAVVREAVESHNGKLWGESEIGKGTTFFVQLPCGVSGRELKIQIDSAKMVLVIDDDPSIREQWRLVLEREGLKIFLCESYEDFQLKKITPQIISTAIVDYHYDNSEVDGGWIIQELKKMGFKNLYLCTAEYWKPSIQKLAKELGILVCPKPLPTIKVEYAVKKDLALQNSNGLKVLVVDDDVAIRSAWELVQNKLKIKQLYCYPNLEALQQNGADLKNIDLAFVDKNIQDSAFNGAEVIEYLSKKEVKKIILASGENADVLSKDPQYSKAHHFIDEKIPKNLESFL